MSFLKKEQLDAVNQVSLKALTSVHKHCEQQDFQNTISWISCVTGFCSDDCKAFPLTLRSASLLQLSPWRMSDILYMYI